MNEKIIQIIKVNKITRNLELGCLKNLGVKTDNDAIVLKFKFDDFVDGEAELLTNIVGRDDKFLPFSLTKNKEDKSYELIVTKELLVNDYLIFQLQIVCNDGVVWHSKQNILSISNCLEIGSGEMPEQISNWLINADLKLTEIENKENNRVKAENDRISNEEKRKENEAQRNINEDSRKKYINEVKKDVADGKLDGATFLPNLAENGDLSWTNDKNLKNPETVNITGPQGPKGDCNFATFEIENGNLIMNKTEDLLLDFELNNGYLEVII